MERLLRKRLIVKAPAGLQRTAAGELWLYRHA
jgi:hypothetical protein